MSDIALSLLDTPYPLTDEQVARYQRDGFIQITGLLHGAELARLRDAVEAAVEAEQSPPPAPGATRSPYEQIFIQKVNLWRRHPAIAEFVFHYPDPTFVARAKAKGGGFIVAGQNYGQGSSREHAAMCPMYLGVKAILARSFARIHHDNLVNFGVVPLTFAHEADYDAIALDDVLEIRGMTKTRTRPWTDAELQTIRGRGGAGRGVQ